MSGDPQKLVVNADDAGADPFVDDCILRAGRDGILTSASVLVNAPHAAAFVHEARAIGLGLGLHFNITEGKPLSQEGKALTREDGLFCSPKQDVWMTACGGFLDSEALRAEFRAQWQRLLQLGVTPDHVDSHNHVHLYPCVLEALLESLPSGPPLHIRVPFEAASGPDAPPPFAQPHIEEAEMRRQISAAGHFSSEAFAGYTFSHRPELASLAHLKDMEAAHCEWMVHPGLREGSDFTSSSKRICELKILMSASVREQIREWGFAPTRFGDLL